MNDNLLGNIGRTLPMKQAFCAHFLRGIDEVVAVTDEMRNWLSRPRHERAVLCADRMIDDVEKLLKKYHDTPKGSESGIHAPLPVILIAFAKDHQAIEPDRNRATPNPEMVQLAENGEFYKMRTDFVSQRVQVAFFAHTSETAKAMTSQMRLYFQRFDQVHFPVAWRFGGYDFELTATMTDMPPSDDLADLADRTNLTVLTWTFQIEYQIPYLSAPVPHETTPNGKLKGFEPLNRVHFDVNGKRGDDVVNGVVDSTPNQAKHGDWWEN